MRGIVFGITLAFQIGLGTGRRPEDWALGIDWLAMTVLSILLSPFEARCLGGICAIFRNPGREGAGNGDGLATARGVSRVGPSFFELS